jgi:hypothetical protein
MVIKESITLHEVADFLNSLLEIDPSTINSMFSMRMFCSKDLANHPAVQVANPKNWIPYVGFIGILNGLFGANENGWGRIAAQYSDNNKIEKFIILDR